MSGNAQGGGGDAVEQERQMQEHEREARERDGREAGEDAGSGVEAAQPAPPGNVQQTGSTG